MFFDRLTAKAEAKTLIRTVRPSPLLVTLVFLLLTTGITYVVSLFATNPFYQALEYIYAGYDPFDVYLTVFGGGRATVLIFISILMTLYVAIMNFGYAAYALRLSRKQGAGYGNLLEGFNLVVKVVLLDIVMSIFIFLWSLLFLIPGLVATYRYSQAVHCLIDHPEIGIMEAIRRSKTVMRGQKFNLFVLQMTFFGWIFLSVLLSGLAGMLAGFPYTVMGDVVQYVVAGIISLWLSPYMSIVNAAFYNNLTGWGKVEEGPKEYRGPELEF